MFRIFWQLLFICAACGDVIYALLGARLTAERLRFARILLLLFYTVVLLVYALVSSGGLFVLGGRASNFEFLYLIAPLISPLLLIINIFSSRWAAIAFWLLFAFVHGSYVSVNWPHVSAALKLLSFDWPLWTAATFFSITVMLNTRSKSARPAANLIG